MYQRNICIYIQGCFGYRNKIEVNSPLLQVAPLFIIIGLQVSGSACQLCVCVCACGDNIHGMSVKVPKRSIYEAGNEFFSY